MAIMSQALYAQAFQLGLRSGYGQLSTIYNNNNKVYTTWDKGIYTRYESKNHIAYELSINHNSFRDRHPGYNSYYYNQQDNIAGYQYRNIAVNNRTDNFQIGATVQYNIICPAIKENCPLFNNISYYIGFSTCLIRTYYKESTTYELIGLNGLRERTRYDNNTALQSGISNMLKYQLTERISINNTISIVSGYHPYKTLYKGIKYNQHESNTRTSITIGLSYKL